MSIVAELTFVFQLAIMCPESTQPQEPAARIKKLGEGSVSAKQKR